MEMNCSVRNYRGQTPPTGHSGEVLIHTPASRQNGLSVQKNEDTNSDVFSGLGKISMHMKDAHNL